MINILYSTKQFCRPIFKTLFPTNGNSQKAISYQQDEYQLGEILAQIALEKLETGIDTDWRKLKPLYIQPPPVFGR